MSAAPAISTRSLAKRFGTRTAVDDVTLDVPQGAFLCVLGANGAGKTTLLRLLATLTRPTSGSASICGIDIAERPEAARAEIGLVAHESMLYADLTATENLEFWASLHGACDPGPRIHELLDAVGLSHRSLDAVRTFSRGMTQRLAIARALVADPAVVLLDEPHTGLDARAAETLDTLVASERAQRTFVMVSHDTERALALATHVLVLARGRVALFGELGPTAPDGPASSDSPTSSDGPISPDGPAAPDAPASPGSSASSDGPASPGSSASPGNSTSPGASIDAASVRALLGGGGASL